jgi:hypothetical protein
LLIQTTQEFLGIGWIIKMKNNHLSNGDIRPERLILVINDTN